MISAEDFYQQTVGKKKDVDGVYGYQCVDLFKWYCQLQGIPVLPAGGDGYADNYWLTRSRYAKYFDFITNPNDLRTGDWCFWYHRKRNAKSSKPISHVAMCYIKNGVKYMYGMNQSPGREACLKTTTWDIAGAFRLKGATKMEIKDGYQEITISGVKVTAYKSDKKVGLINAGGLKRLDQIDMGGILIYERSGNDLFDSAGTVYGPRICLNGQVDEPEDSTNYLYYAILKDGSLSFGDWNGQYKDPSGYQCMFSPKAIYATGVLKYAPQYGIKALSEPVWQAYIAHLADGSFVKGVSKGAITAKALWTGLQAYGADSLAIMDGGSGGIGSAQQRYWNGTKAVYAQSSGRAVGDILVFYEPTASDGKKPTESNETPAEDYKTMYEEKCAEFNSLQAQAEELSVQLETMKSERDEAKAEAEALQAKIAAVRKAIE